ncbi:MAG: helix-turn-helix domain-containing protein [Deltaproteobacteria bacterium]|nr:helix-turn-helix domain-containing protein [Deltaproteobacteria bacterium]
MELPEDYYSLLRIPHNATDDEIRQAYEEAMEMYEEDGVATYGLLTSEERAELLKHVREAYRVLSDVLHRRRYNASLPKKAAEAKISPQPVPSAESAKVPSTVEPHKVPDEILQKGGPFDGPTLRSIREQMAVSLEEISEYTKISIGTLRFVEEERFQVLPPLIYLKAFISQYARYLGLDPHRVVEDYLTRYHQAIGKS